MCAKILVFSIQVIVFLMVNVYTLYADTVVLKSGNVLEGTILEKTDEKIKIRMEDREVTYFLDEIESTTYSIDYGPKPGSELVDINNPEYPVIYNTIKNFYQHQCDDDPAESLKSISKDFRCDDWADLGKTLDYDALKLRVGKAALMSGPYPAEFVAFTGIKMDKLEIAEYDAKADIRCGRVLKDLQGNIETQQIKRWTVSLKKEGDGWKIIKIGGAQ